jgi:Ca2+-binding RTX toxin-like protein
MLDECIMALVASTSEWTKYYVFPPRLVGLGNGTFLALWIDAVDPPNWQIQGQILEASGTAVGEAFVLASITSGDLSDPIAVPLSDGRCAIAWHHNTDGRGTYELHTTIIGASGMPLGNITTLDGGFDPVITAFPDGSYAIGYRQMGDNHLAFFGRDGALSETLNAPSGQAQAIAALGNGILLSVVRTYSTVFGTTITAYLRSPEGQSAPILIATLDGSVREIEVVTLANGNAVVIWREDDALKARILTSQGEILGGEITLYQVTSGLLGQMTVEALPEGGFALAFLRSEDKTNVDLGGFSSTGDIIDFPSVVGRNARGSEPSIAVLKDGRYVLSWKGEYDAPVHFQTYDPRTKSVSILGDDANDRFTGSRFDDALGGRGGADRLLGEGGNDVLDGGSGSDLMFGGAGNDTYYVDSDGDRIVEMEGAGLDHVVTAVSQNLWDEVENLTASGIAGIALNGNNLSNTITGNAGWNALNGKAGNGVLDDGAGADLMTGGAGNDTFVVDDGGDRVLEDKGGGRDSVRTGISFTLASGSEVEELIATGAAGTALKGNALANTIIGNSGGNRLWGGGGHDVLKGNVGRDVFVFDVKANKSNFDRIADFNVKDDTIWLDNKVFTKLGRKGTETDPAKLSKDVFVVGSKAKDKNDYIVYDNKKGILYYDADGSGRGKVAEIAALSKKLAMTYKDFFVI